MRKPTNNNGFYIWGSLSITIGVLSFWVTHPIWTMALVGLSIILMFGAMVDNYLHQKGVRSFLSELTDRNHLEGFYAVELLEAYEEEKPYWELISNKVYADLHDMRFIRDFCPIIAKSERINGAYKGKFLEQGHGNAIRALWERQKMLTLKPEDTNTAKYFLDALEACLACVDTTVVGKAMAREEYKTVEDLLCTFDKQTLKKALNEWPQIRTQEERVPWDRHWGGLWSHFRERYLEAVPASVA